MHGLIGYSAALFLAIPVALPIRNGGLRDTLGRWVTVEPIHLVQYAGLGWMAERYRSH